MAQDHGLDYQQFCFYECKPADGAMSFVGAQCINFEEAEVARIVDPAGNAVDPAFLYASQPQVPFERSSNLLARSRGGCGGVVQSAALLSRSHMVQSANPSASAAVESDSEAAEIVKATVDEVVKGRLRAQTQRRETKSAKENTLKMQEKFAAADPLAAVREIQNAVARSGEAKDSAMKYARTAVNVMQNSHGKMWHDALSAADIEMGRFREESRKAAEAAAYSPKLWREYAAEAAARASKPYLDAVQQSQQIAQQWHIAAGEAVQEAQADQGQANALKIEAEELQQAGQKDQAQAKMDEAKDLDAKSTALFGRARQMVVTAQDGPDPCKEAVASANGNYAVAQEAAKRAGAEVKFPPMAA
mmetsp:Transcript_73710/g.240076  ORF Transcript_73710/g.240076 Transcript_73710/m.240076 type:complete len:361 (-) Transcript_73710:102-1184(-)